MYTAPASSSQGLSPPAREAWIEIAANSAPGTLRWSPPAREAWIEILELEIEGGEAASPPAREAWIEILKPRTVESYADRRLPRGRRGLKYDVDQIVREVDVVASREGGVD